VIRDAHRVYVDRDRDPLPRDGDGKDCIRFRRSIRTSARKVGALPPPPSSVRLYIGKSGGRLIADRDNRGIAARKTLDQKAERMCVTRVPRRFIWYHRRADERNCS